MTSLHAAILVAGISSALLCLAYIHVYFLEKKKFLLIWTLGWILFVLRFAVTYWMEYQGRSTGLLVLNEMVVMTSGVFLVWGGFAFIERPISRYLIWFLPVPYLWIALSPFVFSSWVWVSLPTFTILAAMFVWVGILFLHCRDFLGFPKYLVGWSFILWGLHKMDYPFLRYTPEFATLGFVVGALLSFFVAIGVLLMYLGKYRERSRSSHALFEAIFEQAAVGMVILDLEGTIIRLNYCLARMLGFAPLELQAQKGDGRVHPDDRFIDIDKTKAVMQGTLHSYSQRKRFVRKTGETIWGNVTVSLIHHAETGRPEMLWVIEDVTDQQQLEVSHARSEKLQAIGQLAGGIAHDFNNMLASILGFANILSSELKDPIHRADAKQIEKAAERSAELTQQLLAFSRRGKHQVLPLTISSIVDEVIHLLERTLERRISVHRFIRSPGIHVEGDPVQLKNLFLNLAFNARDAMPHGGMLTFTISDCVRDDIDDTAERDFSLGQGRFVEVSVQDTGVGMPRDVQERMFEPFFTTKPTGQGTGLGLSAVYGTVVGHNGAISVESHVGQGTTFKVYLPMFLVPEQVEGKATVDDESTPTSLNILIIDDEEMVGEVYKEMLMMLGHNATSVVSGSQGIHYYSSQGPFDLVILDLCMPQMSGQEVFFELKRIDPKVKVLISSGHALGGVAQSMIDAGAMAFVQKPCGVKVLSKILDDVLGH